MRFSHAIGFDLDQTILCVVTLRQRLGRVEVLGAERLRLPTDHDEARLIIERWAQAQGIQSLPCVVGLPRDSALLRLLDLSDDQTQTLKERARDRLAQFRALPAEGAVEEYTLLRPAAAGVHMLIGLIRRDSLDNRLRLPEAAGLNVVGAVPDQLAVFHAVASLWPARKGCYVSVHVTAEETVLSIGRGGDLLFVSRFPLGAAQWQSPAQEADEMIGRWLNEIRAALALYATQFAGRRWRVRAILLSGVRSLPPLWQQRLREDTGLAVYWLDEAPRAQRLAGASAFAVAYGLALAGLGRTRAPLSLLPAQRKEGLALRWQFKYWAGSAMLVLLAILMAGGVLQRARARHAAAVESALTQRAALTELDASLAAHDERIAVLRRQIQPLRASVRKGVIVREVLAALAAAKHPDDWIILLADSPSYFPAQDESEAPLFPPHQSALEGDSLTQPMEHLVVEGYTPMADFSTIRALIETLRSHPLIAAIDLLGDDKLVDDPEREARWAFTGARRFALEIKVNGRERP